MLVRDEGRDSDSYKRFVDESPGVVREKYGGKKIELVKESPFNLSQKEREGNIRTGIVKEVLDGDTIRIEPTDNSRFDYDMQVEKWVICDFGDDGAVQVDDEWLQKTYSYEDTHQDIQEDIKNLDYKRKEKAGLYGVRFSNINTDEVGKEYDKLNNFSYVKHKKGQPLGIPARDFVLDAIMGQEIYVDVRVNSNGDTIYGNYQRHVAVVYVKINGQMININRTLIRSGLADFDTYGSTKICQEQLIEWKNDESYAKAKERQGEKDDDVLFDDDINSINKSDNRDEFLGKFNKLKDLRLGDVKFRIQPTAITVDDVSEDNPATVLRNQTTLKGSTGHHNKSVKLSLFFDHKKGDINGVPEMQDFQVEDSDGTKTEPIYYKNGLRSLLAQFKTSPFLPIENKMLNQEHGIYAVSLMNISIQNCSQISADYSLSTKGSLDAGGRAITANSMSNFPDVVKVQLVLMEFNYQAYIDTSHQFHKLIDWDLFRFNYQRLLEGTDIEHYGTKIPKIYELDSSNFSFTLPSTEDLRKKEKAIETAQFFPDDDSEDLRKGDSRFERIKHDYIVFESAYNQKELFGNNDFDLLDESLDSDSLSEPNLFHDNLMRYINLAKIESPDSYDDKVFYYPISYIEKRKERGLILGAYDKAQHEDADVFGFEYNKIMGKIEDSIMSQVSSSGETDRPFYQDNFTDKPHYIVPVRDTSTLRFIIDKSNKNLNELILNDSHDSLEVKNGQLLDIKDNRKKIVLIDEETFNACKTQINDKYNNINQKRGKSTRAIKQLKTGDVSRERWSFDDIYLKDVIITKGNKINTIKLNMHNIPTQQYLGSEDINIALQFVTKNAEQLSLLNEMIDQAKFLQTRYSDIMHFPMLDFDHDLVNLFDLDGVGLKQKSTTTMAGVPGAKVVKVTLSGFKMDYGGHNTTLDEAGSIKEEADYFDVKEQMKYKNLYPDLELPRYKDLPLNHDMHIDRKEKESNYFVEPDFYVMYNRKLFSDYIEYILNKDEEKTMRLQSDKEDSKVIINMGQGTVKVEDGSFDDEVKIEKVEDEKGVVYNFGEIDSYFASIENRDFNIQDLNMSVEVNFEEINNSFVKPLYDNLPFFKWKDYLTLNDIKGSFDNEFRIVNSAETNQGSRFKQVDGELIDNGYNGYMTQVLKNILEELWYPQTVDGDTVYYNKRVDAGGTIVEPENIYTIGNELIDITPAHRSGYPQNYNIGPLQIPVDLIQNVGGETSKAEDNPVYNLQIIATKAVEYYNDLIGRFPTMKLDLDIEHSGGAGVYNNRASVGMSITENSKQQVKSTIEHFAKSAWILSITNVICDMKDIDLDKYEQNEQITKAIDSLLSKLLKDQTGEMSKDTSNIQSISSVKRMGKLTGYFSDKEELDANSVIEFKNVQTEGQNARFKMTYQDLIEYDKRGRLVRAFPTYYLMLIDEGGQYWWWKLKDNFYDYNGVKTIDIVKNRKNVADTCLITLSDGRGLLSDADDAFKNASPELTVGETLFNMTPWGKIENKREQQEKDLTTGVKLETGARIHLRLGYGSSPDKMPPMFNGTITELQLDKGNITFVAQSDGIELTNPVPAKPDETTDKGDGEEGLWDWFDTHPGKFNDPRDILVKYLEDRGGFLANSINKIDQNLYDTNVLGIRHFGLLDKPDFWTNPELAKKYSKLEEKYSSEILEVSQNINTAFINFKDKKDIQFSMFLHGKTVWDIAQTCAMAVPNYIASTHPFGFRSTIFYGHPLYTFSYDYEKNDKGLVDEKVKTYRQTHVYSGLDSIIANKIEASAKGMKTVVKPVAYKDGGNKEELERVYVDTDIYPSQQRMVNVDTSILTDTIFDYGEHGEETAYRVADAALKDYVKNMYKGHLLVTGDPTVKPYDYVNLHDTKNRMNGTFEVQKVVHTLNKQVGFVTSITPDPIAMVNEGSNQTLKYNIFNARVKKETNLWFKKALFDTFVVAATGSGLHTAIMKTAYGISKWSITRGSEKLKEMGEGMKNFAKKFGDNLDDDFWMKKFGQKIVDKSSDIAKYADETVESGKMIYRGSKAADIAEDIHDIFQTGKALVSTNPYFAIGMFLVEESVEYFVLSTVQEVLQQKRENRQAVTIIPLTKNGSEFTAGLNGHKGAILGDDPSKWDKRWNNPIVNYLLGEESKQKTQVRKQAAKYITQNQKNRLEQLTKRRDPSEKPKYSEVVESNSDYYKREVEDNEKLPEHKPENRMKWIKKAMDNRYNLSKVEYKGIKLHPHLVTLLRKLRDLSSLPDISISNEKLDSNTQGANSLYEIGMAVRVKVENKKQEKSILETAYALGPGTDGFRDCGIAVGDGFIHLDLAPKTRFQIDNKKKFVKPTDYY
jgi:endonuclease YncB( thermonuclease family)